MGKKKQVVEEVSTTQFDFEKAYADILAQAKENGMYNDMGFQTLMREFSNLNELCLRMKADVDVNSISDFTEGSKGQLTWKTNPVIKDYNTTVKNLVLVCNALEKKLANIDDIQDSDMFD